MVSGKNPKIGPGWLMPGDRIWVGFGAGVRSSFELAMLVVRLPEPFDARVGGGSSVSVGVAPHRPNNQPLDFLFSVGFVLMAGGFLCSAAIPLSRLLLLFWNEPDPADLVARTCKSLTTAPELSPAFGISSCEGRSFSVCMSIPEIESKLS